MIFSTTEDAVETLQSSEQALKERVFTESIRRNTSRLIIIPSLVFFVIFLVSGFHFMPANIGPIIALSSSLMIGIYIIVLGNLDKGNFSKLRKFLVRICVKRDIDIDHIKTEAKAFLEDRLNQLQKNDPDPFLEKIAIHKAVISKLDRSNPLDIPLIEYMEGELDKLQKKSRAIANSIEQIVKRKQIAQLEQLLEK